MTTARLASARPAPRAGRRSFAPALGRACSRVVGVAARRPGVALAAIALLGGGGLFGWNALTQQPAKHPNPLFATGDARPAKTEGGAKPAAAKPEPPRRADLAPSPPARAEGPGADARGGDAIGALIRSGPGPEATASLRAPEPAAKPAAKPDPKVASAQKALTKLGYGPLKPDGVMGGRTREALLRFEKEKKLPATGAVAGRTAKQLAAASGLAVE